MAYDRYGRWTPDNYPTWDPYSRQSVPLPGYSSNGQPTPGTGYGYGQPNNPAAVYGQQPAGLSVTPKMYHADIVPIKTEADVTNDIVPPNGEARMYMSEDDRLIATKRVGPNGVETVFYDRRPAASPPGQIDPKSVVLRSEINGIVNRVIDERIAQNAPPEPVYSQPETPAARTPAKQTGGKTA